MANYYISSGVVSNGIILQGDSMYISNGGIAEDTTVNSSGNLRISSGGTATAIKENGGYVYVAEGAEVTFAANTISGLVLSSGSATVHSGTVANSTTVNSRGSISGAESRTDLLSVTDVCTSFSTRSVWSIFTSIPREITLGNGGISIFRMRYGIF